MMTSCPSPTELERAFFTKDTAIEGHAKDCASCGDSWRQIASLSELALKLETPPSDHDRRERLRTVLITRRQQARPRSKWPLAAALAAAAAIAAGVLMMEPGSERREREPVASIERGRIHALDRAHFWTARTQPDEIVRLVDGSIAIDVDHLEPGERFRVVTGDGEVEVRGTTFDVAAASDSLREVRVVRGTVEVRFEGAPAATLRDGERWRAPEAAPAAATPEPEQETAKIVKRKRPVEEPAPEKMPPAAEDRIAFEAGWEALRSGSFGAAAESFARARELAREPGLREDALYFLAVSHARAGDGDRAVESFEAFLAEHSASARAGEAAAMLGWLLYDRREDDRAREMFQRAIDSGSRRAVDSGRGGLQALKRRRM